MFEFSSLPSEPDIPLDNNSKKQEIKKFKKLIDSKFEDKTIRKNRKKKSNEVEEKELNNQLIHLRFLILNDYERKNMASFA